MNISKINNRNIRKIKSPENTLEKNSLAFDLPDFVNIPETTGMNAEFIEPSANNLLNKFGNLKATKNASEIKPAPIIRAISKSLQ
tara:strand:+ start:550 stop:804 length:255 start_codon:yes stop_codon:yes gene_type:complete